MAAVTPLLMFFQDYHYDCKVTVNIQINQQLYASYMYLCMAVHCTRFDVALKGFSRYFLRRSHQWSALAEKLMSMHIDRGGFVAFSHIRSPFVDDWDGGLHIMEYALGLEKSLNKCLLELHHLAKNKEDITLCNFLKCHYLGPQVHVLKEISEHLTNIRKLGTLGEDVADYIFDNCSLK
ncbi:ferritin heavy chain-like [Fukomys damarensis]|uniref:Ferritin n=1 Tax=Fukomys damarensis TaxID=885580 RepID=A0A091DCQ3_FUKDA|nr:ferritin heavy chain-like [Fukomys damarensis]KFO28233.1 Ferritin heavy chain [Fukomys damarensis]